MRNPLIYFTLVFAAGIAMTTYCIWELIHTGFSAFLLFFTLLIAAGTVSMGLDLKRFRLTPGGLAVQHLFTRRTRVIPYEAIDQLSKTFQRGNQNTTSQELLKIRYDGRLETMRFFDREQRDEIHRRLEACRQGDIEGNVGQPELPSARVVTRSEGWIYPWRRPQQQEQQQP